VNLRRACATGLACGLSLTFVVADRAGASHEGLELISVDSAESQANDTSNYPVLSADSRFVAFTSDATNLVAGDTNNTTDVFVRDRLLGTTERVSVGPGGVQGDGYSYMPWLNGNGRYVVFYSEATNLVDDDTNGARDVFVRDRQTGTTERVSVDSAGAQGNGASSSGSDNDRPTLSANGRYVVFSSSATNLVDVDTNGKRDYFLHDRQTGHTELISVSSDEVQGNGDTHSDAPSEPRGQVALVSVSDDGRYVAFSSQASNLAGIDTSPGPYAEDIFVRDRVAGTTELISHTRSDANTAAGRSVQPVISRDGRYVAFSSGASPSLADPASAFGYTVYVHDRDTDTTVVASQSDAGTQSAGNNANVAMSPDGRRVAWETDAFLEGDNDGFVDVFVRDLVNNTTERMSVPAAGGNGTNHNIQPALSAHPGFAAFTAFGDDMAPGDTNTKIDVVAHLGYDLTPPVITPVVSGTLGDNGWYTSDVHVSWTVSDPESTPTSRALEVDGQVTDGFGCGPTPITADTDGMTITCHAMSAAHPTSASVTIKRDATPPTIGHVVVPAPPDGANGWFVTGPTVTFSCADATSPGSGLAGCLADGQPGPSKTLGESASAQSVGGTATDQAGNQTQDAATNLEVDLSDPSIGHTIAPLTPDGTNGWYTTAPTVTFNCTDPISGVGSCLADGGPGAAKTLGEDASPQSVAGAVTDVAGRTAADSVSGLKVDLSDPTITHTIAPAVPDGTNGWYKTAPTVTFNCTDPISGVGSCLADGGPGAAKTLGENASPQSVAGAVTDVAGRTAADSVSGLKVDLSAPTVTCATTAPVFTLNEAGASVSATVADATSGPVASTVSGPASVARLGNFNRSLTGTDLAGNTTVKACPYSVIYQRTLSVNNVTVVEGNSGNRTTNFAVSLSVKPRTGQTVTVNVATANGTATAGSDYTAVPLTTLTWTSTDLLSKYVTVTVNGDTLMEGNETFALNLSSPTKAVLADGSGTATIVDEEGRFSVSVNDASVTEGNSGTKNLAFLVKLSAAPAAGQTVTVNAASADGSAKVSGNDYNALVPNPTTLTFNPGELTKTVNIVIKGDSTVEPNETLQLNLSLPTTNKNTTVADSQGVGTIINDDGSTGATPRSISVTDVSILEGNSGTKIATFNVTLSTRPTSGTVTVKYATADGTATAGSDYTARPLTALTWTTNSSDPLTKPVTVTLTGDTLKEGNETFKLNLSAPTNATLADASGTATIIDEEGTFYASVGNAAVNEGTNGSNPMPVTVTLSAAPAVGQTVTLHIDSTDGSATVTDEDYIQVSQTLTFTAGQTTKIVNVPIANDSTPEPNETFTLNLSTPSNNLVIADPSGLATIINDD
jgi:hypothetical protein